MAGKDITQSDVLDRTWKLTRQAYLDAGIGIDYWPSDRRIRRLTREEWEESENVDWPGKRT